MWLTLPVGPDGLTADGVATVQSFLDAGVRLDGVNDMDAARAQVGRVYYLAKADARLPKGRFFIDDLLDCEVVDAETGRVYGRLTNVDRPAAFRCCWAWRSWSASETMCGGMRCSAVGGVFGIKIGL